MYKEWMLKCEVYNTMYNENSWEKMYLYFDTEEEMIEYVKEKMKYGKIKVESAFHLEKLNNNMFV